MKKNFSLTVVFFLIINLIYAQTIDVAPSNTSPSPSNSPSPSPSPLLEMTIQFEFDTYDNSGEAGCESDGSYIYTALWNGSSFIKYSLDGTYLETFQIAGVSQIRDLAYDGQYFYGSDASTTVYVLDFNNKSLIRTFTAPTAVRAIAYDDDNDVFYTNNFNSDIVKFDKSGVYLTSFTVGSYGSYYGFAYDNWTDGGPFLWGYSQDGNRNMLVQIQLPSGNETGVVYDVEDILVYPTDGIAGGLFIQPNLIDGTISICGNIQNEKIWGLKLGNSKPVPVFPAVSLSIFLLVAIGIVIKRRFL